MASETVLLDLTSGLAYYDLSEGVAGHITCRVCDNSTYTHRHRKDDIKIKDPVRPDCYWLNPLVDKYLTVLLTTDNVQGTSLFLYST